MKKYAVIHNGKIIGIFNILACAKIYASGLENACIQQMDLL
jgi:hypothetical protein